MINFKLYEKVKFIDQEGFGVIKELRKHSALVENEFGFEEEFDLKNLLPYNATFSVEKVIMKEVVYMPKIVKPVEIERIVDLHFTQLVDYVKGFTPHKMLQKQLIEAQKAIEGARNDKVQKLILIHGKGKGILEAELYKILEKQKDIEYYDADYKRYKLGAVAIKFKNL